MGYHAYWPQFEGLYEELKGKLETFVGRVETYGVEVHEFGIVDDAKSAYATLTKLKSADLDLVFCDMLTYATSASFGAIIRGLDVPIVLVALQPLKALDYSKASTYMQLCNDDFCSVPEFTGVAIRMGKKPPPVVLGTLHDDPAAEAEIRQWCQIAKVLHDLKSSAHRPFRPPDRAHAGHADRPDSAHRGLWLPRCSDRSRRLATCLAKRDARRKSRPRSG